VVKARKQRQCLRRKSTTSTMIAITMMAMNIGCSLTNQAARQAGGDARGRSQAVLNPSPRCVAAW
jgi:hypothetical protein